MRRVNVRFIEDTSRDGIDVLFMASEEDEQVKALMARISDPLEYVWEVRDAQGNSVALPEERISSVSVDNKRLRIVAEDGTYWLKMPLADAERALNPSLFLRVSRFDIVNLRKVRRFDFSVAGALRVEMENGDEIWVSRRFIPAVKERLKGQR